MTDSPDLAAELEFVKALAREAAAVALARSQRVTPHEKANLSYVTDLDHDLERLIRERLGDAFPDDLLTGEEYARRGGQRAAAVVDRPDRRHRQPGPRPAALGHQHRPDRRGRAGPGRDRRPAAGRAVLGRQGGRGLARRPPAPARDADAFHTQDNVCVGHQRPAGRRPAVAARPAPRPGQRLLRADRSSPPTGSRPARSSARRPPRRRRRPGPDGRSTVQRPRPGLRRRTAANLLTIGYHDIY